MSLAELLNSLDVPETDDDDEDFDASLADAMQFGEYEEAEGEEEQEEADDPFEDYCQPVLGEKSGVSPQWPSRMRALFHGSLEGGDLTSQTGILAGVAPMLLHASQSQHPERPARLVAIYHELFEQELVARARLVPARLVSNEDLALVHDRKHVRRATATLARYFQTLLPATRSHPLKNPPSAAGAPFSPPRREPLLLLAADGKIQVVLPAELLPCAPPIARPAGMQNGSPP